MVLERIYANRLRERGTIDGLEELFMGLIIINFKHEV